MEMQIRMGMVRDNSLRPLVSSPDPVVSSHVTWMQPRATEE